MLLGMGIVFVFLILLMWYMKFVPILSRWKRSKDVGSAESSNKSKEEKFKLKTAIDKMNDSNSSYGRLHNENEIPEAVVAAIAAAIFSHTGKKPKQLLITAPGGIPQQYNVWGVAGRQDQMLARDMAGQVGFQY
jgi:sodium pump decarboxylase gamma subunit